MFEAAVDGFGGAVAGVGVVEVGQDVPGSAFECPAQRDELGQTPRYARGGQGSGGGSGCHPGGPRCARGGQCVDFGLH